jgi:hypothetical protein
MHFPNLNNYMYYIVKSKSEVKPYYQLLENETIFKNTINLYKTRGINFSKE